MESRTEWGWVLGLGLLALVLGVFLLVTGGEGKEAWPEQFERGLIKRGAGLEFFADSRLVRVKDVFDAKLSEPLRARDFGPTRFWLIAVGNLGLVLALLLTRPLWLSEGKKSVGEKKQEDGKKKDGGVLGEALAEDADGLVGVVEETAGEGKTEKIGSEEIGGFQKVERSSGWNGLMARRWGWWAGFAAVLLVGLVVRLPRMGLSLYNDEVMNLKRYTIGNFEGYEPGKDPNALKFFARDWQTTLWDNEFGANPAGFTVLSRLGHEGWRQATDAPEGAFAEWPLRLSALLGGVLVMASLALGLRSAGWAGAGLAAAGWWALHPWAVRYSTEARPYGLMMGLLALLLVALVAAVRGNRWRAWITVALAEALALWVTPGCLWMVFFFNAVVGVWLLLAWLRRRDPAARGLRRMVVATALGVGLWLQLAGPGLPEFHAALTTTEVAGIRKPIPSGWWSDFGALALTGLVRDDGQGVPAAMTWKENGQQVMVVLLGLGYLVFLLLTGLLWRDQRARIVGEQPGQFGLLLALVAAGLASVVLAYFVSLRSGTALYTWYQVQVTLPLAVLVGVALQAAWRGVGSRGATTKVRWVALGLVAAAIVVLGWRGSGRLRDLPKEDPRGLAQALGGGRFPEMAAADQPLRGLSFVDADYYDPGIEEVKDLARLRQLEDQARREGKELRFAIGHVGGGSSKNDEIFQYLTTSSQWKMLVALPGLEEFQYASWVFEFEG